MNRVARRLEAAEVALGLDSFIVHSNDEATHGPADSADVHVVHTHCSDKTLRSSRPKVWIPHGTPEVMFLGSHEEAVLKRHYGHPDSWMLAQWWLQNADAIVTFWPRHRQIWQSLCDRKTEVLCTEIGTDLAFWGGGPPSEGRFAGTPSVFTAENCYTMKWPLDLFIAWPWVVASDPGLFAARLHAIYVPTDQHRNWFPLVNRNGCSFVSHISSSVFGEGDMRNAFRSTDFYCGLVRYGDHNMTCLDARAAGATLISYEGNPYAHYWITEGDQRRIAGQLAAILRGEAPRREALPVPDISRTAAAMAAIYKELGA
jgi:hypothetical protein